MMAATGANDQAGATEQGRLFHLREAIRISGAMLAALLALATGGLALLFQLYPQLVPDPRTRLGAEAKVYSIDPNVNLGRYLARRSAIVSATKYADEKRAYIQEAGGPATGTSVLSTPGEDVFVNLDVQGFKSRSIAMLASIYDAKSRNRLSQIDDWPVFQEQLDSPSDQSVIEFWLPAPPVTVSDYWVRVEVYHRGDGVLLAVTDSKVMRVGT
jgi:hypothetical protein